MTTDGDGRSRAELLEALREGGAAVVSALAALPEAALAGGAYESGWTAREVLAHVAAIEWTYPRLIDLAEQARAATDDRAGDGRPAPDMDGYNQRQVAKRAEASVEELVAEFRRNRAATMAAVEAVDDALLATPIRSTGGASGPLSAVLWSVAVEHVQGHVEDILRAARR